MANKRRVTRSVSTTDVTRPELAEVGERFWIVLTAALALVLIMLLYRMLFSDTSYAKLDELRQQLADQEQLNATIAEENRRLTIEIEALKKGDIEIETRAREDLGLIKPGETFFHIIEEQNP